jgi:acyl-coenzyme A thioesterase PaaI-like protein
MTKTKQATSRECFVCGVENPSGLHMHFYTISPGEVEAHHTLSAQYQGYPGVVHGGIIASMLDEVMGRVFMEGDPPRFMVTAELKIRYKKPVPVNTLLKLSGHRVKDNGRIGQAIGEIIGPDGDVLVTGEITVVNMPGETMNSSELEKMGWKLYPEMERIV